MESYLYFCTCKQCMIYHMYSVDLYKMFLSRITKTNDNDLKNNWWWFVILIFSKLTFLFFRRVFEISIYTRSLTIVSYDFLVKINKSVKQLDFPCILFTCVWYFGLSFKQWSSNTVFATTVFRAIPVISFKRFHPVLDSPEGFEK